MKKLGWLIIIIALIIVFLVGIKIYNQLVQPAPRTITPVVLGELSVPTSENIAIDEAIAIIEEAKDSHILFKAALEIDMTQPTEWTGMIVDQDRIIARYEKVLALLRNLKLPTPVAEKIMLL